jgi:hypothetical protein
MEVQKLTVKLKPRQTLRRRPSLNRSVSSLAVAKAVVAEGAAGRRVIPNLLLGATRVLLVAAVSDSVRRNSRLKRRALAAVVL